MRHGYATALYGFATVSQCRPLEFRQQLVDHQPHHLPVTGFRLREDLLDFYNFTGLIAPPHREHCPPILSGMHGKALIDPAPMETSGGRRHVHPLLVCTESNHTTFAKDVAGIPFQRAYHLKDQQTGIVVAANGG